jgi:phosphatidylinositol alpha-1,6-mannosyltransferase
VSPRYLVLTPGLVGRDGIAEVSRLIVGALTQGDAATPVDVVSVADPPGLARAAGGATRLRHTGAGGRKLRFIASSLRAAVAGGRPTDVVCLHVGMSPLAWAIAGRARLTVFLHGIEAWRPIRGIERWALGRADTLVANSEHTAGRFRAANPAFRSTSVRICHLGVAPVGDGGQRAASSGDAPFALIVGRMAAAERYKGHDLLLDIWPTVRAEVPRARLVVAGDGDDRARLEAKAASLGNQVSFCGHVSDAALAALYRDCAFFVMPSRDEGFGLVFLEAMRAGRACIGGVGAPAEVIEDGVTGLVVDPADPEQVLKAVLRLFREPETRERMGRAGAERMARQFTEAHFRSRFRAILGCPPDPA